LLAAAKKNRAWKREIRARGSRVSYQKNKTPSRNRTKYKIEMSDSRPNYFPARSNERKTKKKAEREKV